MNARTHATAVAGGGKIRREIERSLGTRAGASPIPATRRVRTFDTPARTWGEGPGTADNVSDRRAPRQRWPRVLAAAVLGVTIVGATAHYFAPFAAQWFEEAQGSNAIVAERGDSGNQVRLIQSLLRTRWGFDHLSVDGQYGPITEQAVKDVQASLGLPVTGVVDRETYERLYGN
jgi:hypothetical protein